MFWKVDTLKTSTSGTTLITVTIVAYVAKRKSCFIVKPNTLIVVCLLMEYFIYVAKIIEKLSKKE